ncbi:MAG: hydantoinase B/oxoprolinase family protein [Pseudomonadota bacterium]
MDDRTREINAVDPIKVAVIGNRLNAISKEIGLTMLRTSRSPIFSEARDFVTGIFDAQLRLVAQSAYIPVLMMALPYALKSIARTFEGDIEEGDIFILNDPYHGNNHPPDITIAKPVFFKGEIRFWAVSKGHHADVGGGGVAGYNPGAQSVRDEGIRIPPAKLYIAGKLNKGLLDTILLNVHLPFLVEGDINCQVGAVTIGQRGLRTVLEKYDRPTLEGAIEQLFNASEKQMRLAVSAIPNGRYSGERLIDHDGIEKDRMIAVRVTLNIEGDQVHFDFSASDAQAKGYVNSTVANTASSAYLALFMSVGEDVSFNEGALRALSVTTKPGTVVDALEPAPVTGCTVTGAQAIIEAVWLALAQAAPEKVDACWSRWCAPASMGVNPHNGRPFADIHFMSKGGAGASQGLDGWDHLGTVCCAGGLRAPDPELHELVTPYKVLQYEFWPDSAGAGEWRGGMGTIYRWEVEADDIAVANFGGGNRDETTPFGLEGGHAAPPHQLYLLKDGHREPIDTEMFLSFNKNDVFEIYQSGGGGFGDPRQRAPEKVRSDVVDGLVSQAKAEQEYGVVLDASLAVDIASTTRRRAKAVR